jgi:hypothetical protein
MPAPTLRAEVLSAISQRLAAIREDIGRIDTEISMLEGSDHDRLDVAAGFLRIIVDEIEQRVDAMAAGR